MSLTVQNVFDLLERFNEQVDFASKYGEMGYTNPKSGIIFADWNNIPKYIQSGLMRRGFELEWSDEWIIIHESSKAYRTSPDSYSWQPFYWIDKDGEVYGGDEIEEENSSAQKDYVEYLTNNPNNANVFSIDFEKYGFKKSEEIFENGFHSGMNDNPKEIFKKFENDFDVIFDMKGGQSQFYVSFTVWLKKKEI